MGYVIIFFPLAAQGTEPGSGEASAAPLVHNTGLRSRPYSIEEVQLYAGAHIRMHLLELLCVWPRRGPNPPSDPVKHLGHLLSRALASEGAGRSSSTRFDATAGASCRTHLGEGGVAENASMRPGPAPLAGTRRSWLVRYFRVAGSPTIPASCSRSFELCSSWGFSAGNAHGA